MHCVPLNRRLSFIRLHDVMISQKTEFFVTTSVRIPIQHTTSLHSSLDVSTNTALNANILTSVYKTYEVIVRLRTQGSIVVMVRKEHI
jgi:hypothetical protein